MLFVEFVSQRQSLRGCHLLGYPVTPECPKLEKEVGVSAVGKQTETKGHKKKTKLKGLFGPPPYLREKLKGNN